MRAGVGSVGEEWSMTRLRLAPRSLWGPLGPPQSSPLTALQQTFSIPFQVHLIVFFVYLFQMLRSSLFYDFFALSGLLKEGCCNRGTPGPVSACLLYIPEDILPIKRPDDFLMS